MFWNFFKKKEVVRELESEIDEEYIIASINARVQPLDRGELYEDPLDEKIQELSLGEVTGGGSFLEDNGEIASCDIEICVKDSSEETINIIKETLEKLNIPKGSKLTIKSTDREIQIGKSDGMAIYINGTDLDESVYKECDSNVVYEELNRLLKNKGSIHSHWQGTTETALYLYGESFEEMNSTIKEFLNTYPLCEKCRVVQIA